MNYWQNWIVFIVVAACFAWVAYKLYVIIIKAKRNENPCSSCTTGCSVKKSEVKQKESTKKSEKEDKKRENNCCTK